MAYFLQYYIFESSQYTLYYFVSSNKRCMALLVSMYNSSTKLSIIVIAHSLGGGFKTIQKDTFQFFMYITAAQELFIYQNINLMSILYV